MNINIELKDRTLGSARAIVAVEFPEGGFTATIFVRNVNGKPKFTVPLDKRNHPTLTLRGDLKKMIFGAIWECFNSGETKSLGNAKTVT